MKKKTKLKDIKKLIEAKHRFMQESPEYKKYIVDMESFALWEKLNLKK